MSKAVRWTDDRKLGLIDYAPRDPGPGEIQIKVGSAGICGSDLHFYRGDFPAQPGIVPGHEFAGTISAAGANVSEFQEGDLVAVEPILSCGHCRFCLSGDYHVCARRALIGEASDGGMSEFVTVPASTAFKVPDGVDSELGALAEPLACSTHAFAKANLKGYETVLILGAGTIGLTALLAAKAYGATAIIVARHPHQQAAARTLGADEVIEDNDTGEARLTELRRQGAIDVAVETVGGKGETLLIAQLALRAKGRLLLVGVFTKPNVPINPLHLALREIQIIGSMTYALSDGRSDFGVALDVLADHGDVARTLVTHRFPLAQVDDAFAASADKSTQSIKVMLKPGT